MLAPSQTRLSRRAKVCTASTLRADRRPGAHSHGTLAPRLPSAYALSLMHADCPAGQTSTAGATSCTGTSARRRLHRNAGARLILYKLTQMLAAAAALIDADTDAACPVNTYSVAGGLCVSCQANSNTAGTNSATCRCNAGYAAGSTYGPNLVCTRTRATVTAWPLAVHVVTWWGRMRSVGAQTCTACSPGFFSAVGAATCSGRALNDNYSLHTVTGMRESTANRTVHDVWRLIGPGLLASLRSRYDHGNVWAGDLHPYGWAPCSFHAAHAR